MATRHFTPKFTGLFHDETDHDSYWIRECGTLSLPALTNVKALRVTGVVLPAPENEPTAQGAMGLRATFDGREVFARTDIAAGAFEFAVSNPGSGRTTAHELRLELLGVGGGNFLAWLGRITGLGFLQPWRAQHRNRRLRIKRVEADGEIVFDFANRASPWNGAYVRRFLKVGMNIVGFFRADLGVGESARCMARAADGAGLPAAFVDLRLHCKNPQNDETFASRLQESNPHPVNVFHVDAPGVRDIDHCHGKAFRTGKYNVGYWAWELPDFPDAWVHFSSFVDEIWTPSHFTAEAIARKVPVPVLAMPHSISFERPVGDFRAKFGLPADKLLFLVLYDLNSYSERKNPAGAIEAFRRSGLAGRGASLVIKVHNAEANPADFVRLQSAAAELPGTVLINRTMSRREVYELESACDVFVSLHRSEGYGLAIAESMYLGKPVIATDWSGSSEIVSHDNGCPVRCSLITLDRNHGPYAKGQIWADPDLDHAADWMRRLSADANLRERLGAAGRATIETKFSPAAIGALYRQRLEAIASW
jgi:glycosyltransferase involved in cell wall biosynthesis